jgi:L-lysine epsilon oxidase C-terminal domain
LRRLSNLQWVNKGFATIFGRNCPMDFDNEELIARLSSPKDAKTNSDPNGELRQAIFNCFRPSDTPVNEPRTWPWIYGDAFGSFASTSPKNNLGLSPVKQALLQRWVEGHFANDWDPQHVPARSIEDVPLAEQPAMLDRSALQFCLADAFHPGCEMTWPMRHASAYEKPFRLRHRPPGQPEPDYGAKLTQQIAQQPGGLLYQQAPGDVTRWMAVPWQGDTASCRSGYEPEYDPYLPTFWPARVPNQVLTEEDYQTVMDTALPREQRLAAYTTRLSWFRTLKGSAAQVMMQMVAHFGAMGVVEIRPGIKNDPDFPETMYVESLAGSRLKATSLEAARLLRALPVPHPRAIRAGWENQEQFEEFRRIRMRQE